MIEVQQLTKAYNNITAIKDIDLTIEKGEIFGIIGYSGAGKSTLLRCLNLLEKPTEGKIFVDEEDITKLSDKEIRKKRQEIGMIFQHFYLISAKTVYENVAFFFKSSR